jgi:PIN domain nuclease of toxin-antitoxin system
MIVAIADTHAILWYLFQDTRLSQTAKNFFDTSANNAQEIGISGITLVEMVYLIERSRISPQAFSLLASKLTQNNSLFVEIPIDVRIARALSAIDATQIPDMPDRIIAASALVYKVPVISRDGKIRASSIQTIW